MRRIVCWFTGHRWQERERTVDVNAHGSGLVVDVWHGLVMILFSCVKCGAFTRRTLHGTPMKDSLERMYAKD